MENRKGKGFEPLPIKKNIVFSIKAVWVKHLNITIKKAKNPNRNPLIKIFLYK